MTLHHVVNNIINIEITFSLFHDQNLTFPKPMTQTYSDHSLKIKYNIFVGILGRLNFLLSVTFSFDRFMKTGNYFDEETSFGAML